MNARQRLVEKLAQMVDEAIAAPRCDACTHWNTEGRAHINPATGWCSRMREPDSKAYAEMYDGVITEADFGCVQWEALLVQPSKLTPMFEIRQDEEPLSGKPFGADSNAYHAGSPKYFVGNQQVSKDEYNRQLVEFRAGKDIRLKVEP